MKLSDILAERVGDEKANYFIILVNSLSSFFTTCQHLKNGFDSRRLHQSSFELDESEDCRAVVLTKAGQTTFSPFFFNHPENRIFINQSHAHKTVHHAHFSVHFLIPSAIKNSPLLTNRFS